MILTLGANGQPISLEIMRSSASNRHARVGHKLMERIKKARKNDFEQAWITRNICRWKRIIRKEPPFRPSKGDPR